MDVKSHDSPLISMSLFVIAYGTIIMLNCFKTSDGDHHSMKRKPVKPKGSFLLKNHDSSQSLAFKVLEKYKKELAVQERNTNLLVENITTPRTYEIGKSLIQSHNQNMGPNLSLFYKDDGGLVIEKGKGVYMVRNTKLLEFSQNTILFLYSILFA